MILEERKETQLKQEKWESISMIKMFALLFYLRTAFPIKRKQRSFWHWIESRAEILRAGV